MYTEACILWIFAYMMYKIDLHKYNTHERVLAVDTHMYVIQIRATKHQHCLRKWYSPVSHILSESEVILLSW